LQVASTLPVSGSFSFRYIQLFSILFSMVLFLSSCEKEDIYPAPPPNLTLSDFPALIAMDPAYNENEVMLDKSITATFNQQIDTFKYMVNFTLQKDTEMIEGTVVFDGNNIIFTPTSSLEPGTEYIVEIHIVENNAGAHTEEKYFSSVFTTMP